MDFDALQVGYDIPCRPGQPLAEVLTPALLIDLDAMERNLERMRSFLDRTGLRLRAHAKTHKCAEIARLQIERGGAVGICCQKVSEAEAMVRAGIADVLVSNEVWGPQRADRLAALAGQARISVCVDALSSVDELSRAARRHGTTIDVLIEVEVGAGRCGICPGEGAVPFARAIEQAQGLRFAGLQAYHGSLQHIADAQDRKAAVIAAAGLARDTVDALETAGFSCDIVSGAGTGSFVLDAEHGALNELQCGSYVFMDADYDRIEESGGGRPGGMENALFVLAGVMSTATPGRAVCDAGLKALAVDSGLPRIDRQGVQYIEASDEHGTLLDPDGLLRLGDQVKLVPGHCDPTCNLHDWYVGLRGGVVECLWPVTARGKLF